MQIFVGSEKKRKTIFGELNATVTFFSRYIMSYDPPYVSSTLLLPTPSPSKPHSTPVLATRRQFRRLRKIEISANRRRGRLLPPPPPTINAPQLLSDRELPPNIHTRH